MRITLHPIPAAGLVLLLGLGLTIATSLGQQRANDADAKREISALAESVVQQVTQRIQLYNYGLLGTRAAYMVGADAGFSRRSFNKFSSSRDYEKEFPGANGFGLIWRVPRSQEEAFVARARQDGWPDFKLRQLSPHDGERFVIQYTFPVEKNRSAVGLDIASETNRREAALAAARSGKTTLTAPITLVQATGKPLRSFLILLPIYRPGAQVGTDEAREAAALGWAYAPLVFDEVLARLALGSKHFTLSLRDMADPANTAFFTSPGHDKSTPTTFRHVQRLAIFGRAWEIEVHATREFIAGLRLTPPSLILQLGGLLTFILSLLTFQVAKGYRQGLEIRQEQARRASILESSSDAIIGQTLDGVITDWNLGATRMFGYKAKETLGKHLDSVLSPPDTEQTEGIRSIVLREGSTPAYESTRHHRDGTSIDVSIQNSVIVTRDGHHIGLSMILRDIRETKRAEEAIRSLNSSLEQQVQERTALLEAARHDLQTLMDAVPSMIGYWDKNLINRAANRAYAAWAGKAAEELPGRHMRDIVGQELFDSIQDHVLAVLRGEKQTFELTLSRPGYDKPVHVLTHYIPDLRQGEVQGFHVLTHDVSELVESRMWLAAALRDNAALLQTINTQAIVSVTDPRGVIIEANERFCSISGYSREELIGNTHRVVNSGTHAPGFWADMWRTVSSGESWRAEVCNRAKDGSLYWVDSIISPFVGEDGSIQKYISLRTDISARKQMEVELEATSVLLGGVLDAASEISIIATDLDGTITLFNRGAERMLGYDAEEMVEKCTTAIIHLESEARARSAELSARHGEAVEGFRVFVHESEIQGSETSRWTYVRKDGGQVPVRLTVTAIRNEHGELKGYLGIALDIRQQEAYEQSLRDAMAREQLANQAKSRFLANMSHEIRTPMNAVIGLSHLLDRTPLNADQKSLLDKLQIASTSLLAIINDILDLSKVEAGEMRLENTPFLINGLVHELAELYGSQASAKHLSFSVRRRFDQSTIVEGDATRLRQVLSNLLSNAIKFTAKGEVALIVSSSEIAESTQQFRFEVQDSGIGIPEGIIPTLFQPFTQADVSTTRHFGGTGLGLSIVRELVNLMGSEIHIESKVGRGSAFWFELDLPVHTNPLVPEEAQPATAEQTPGLQLANVRVLLVDDSSINQLVAQRILELEKRQPLHTQRLDSTEVFRTPLCLTD